MSAETGVEWCDHTFNIVWGCEKVSPACRDCYAEGIAKWRGYRVWGAGAERRVLSDAYWREPGKWNLAAAAAGQVARVFCSSMADVFEAHPTVAQQRARLWPLIERTPWLLWLLLTKRPENVRNAVPSSWLDRWPANVLPGFTAENQEWFDRRVVHTASVPSSWFVSYEPALGPVDFGDLRRVSWLIVGGESGRRARAMDPAWVRSARDQAGAAGVRFFYKQKVEGREKVSLPMLDGRQWTEAPASGGLPSRSMAARRGWLMAWITRGIGMFEAPSGATRVR